MVAKPASPRTEDLQHLQDREKKLQELLELVFNLLEQYAPAWYTQELHDRIEAALRD